MKAEQPGCFCCTERLHGGKNAGHRRKTARLQGRRAGGAMFGRDPGKTGAAGRKGILRSILPARLFLPAVLQGGSYPCHVSFTDRFFMGHSLKTKGLLTDHIEFVRPG